MNPISNFAQSLREYPSIQGTILRFPAPFWSIYFFLIPIRSVFIHSFVQRGTHGGVCWVLMLTTYLTFARCCTIRVKRKNAPFTPYTLK
jgi:hypothetical protein